MEATNFSLLLSNGQPVVSCFAIPQDEIIKRMNLAHERAEATATAEKMHPDDALINAKLTLWHTDFSEGLLAMVQDSEFFRLAADLPSLLLRANGEGQLDFWDYAYVADLLREWLLAPLSASDLQKLSRALAWAEKKGIAFRERL